MKYVDNSTNNDRITNNNESSYWKELNSHAEWSAENELLLNMSKVKELIVGFMKKEQRYSMYLSMYVIICCVPPDYRPAFFFRL